MTDAPDTLWYKDAIIYQIPVKSFFDANDDGVGDFPGLIEKLDYIRDLGVTMIWLMPFYPSPLKDDGYDISDYRTIAPAYGTLRDFKAFVRAAHERGLKVLIELVINHTSDLHPWFQRARRAPKGSWQRDFYVWTDDPSRWKETRIIFTDTEPSNWTYDSLAGQHYWHRFFSHQPDLNFDSPRVMRAVIAVMRFWLDMGVDGLRLDAIPYLVERDGTINENLPETHDVLKRLRAAMDETHPHAFFLAEANQWPEDTLPYFGDGDECQMAFHFPLMPRMYMAMAMEDRHPVTDIMRQTPEIPANCQWAIFLRNHDELTLEMVTERERDYMWRFYAADIRGRINLGIRRRLAPLMENDRRKIELMNSLLFSMPGTPVVYYGDEIGMGDNVYLGDRNGVRTPMQWSPDRNGGFSKANPASLIYPAIMDAVYGFAAINVEAQQRSAASLYSWMRRMMTVRQAHRAFGRGALTFLYPGNRKVFAYLRELDDQSILCVANLSRQAQAVEVDLARFKGRVPVELLGRSAFPPIGELTYLLTLPAYGFYWFLLAEEAQVPTWHEALPEPVPDFYTLLVAGGWASLTDGRVGQQFTAAVLPPFIAKQRWFGGKGAAIRKVEIAATAPLPHCDNTLLGMIVDLDLAGADPQRYFVPVGLQWDETAVSTVTPMLPFTLGKIRKGGRVGALIDATIDRSFATAILEQLRDAADTPAHPGTLRYTAGSGFAAIEVMPEDEIRRVGVEQSNSSILIGSKAVLKAYRRLVAGPHPEVEIGRFLTEVARFDRTPALLGSVEHVGEDGTATAIVVVQSFARNQGDGWTFVTEYLARELEQPPPAEGPVAPQQRFALYAERAHTLGIRTAQLHRALATPTDDPAFAAEPLAEADFAALRADTRKQAAAAFAALERAGPTLPATAENAARDLQTRRGECEALIDRLAARRVEAAKTRHHGDFHLGQILVDQNDLYFVDFEGEPTRPLDERRAKQSPLRDVAGMLRSFDYAAWAAADRVAQTHPDSLEAFLVDAMACRELASRAFLDGYFATIGDSPGMPADRDAALGLLDLFVLQKALYEIAYEAANRPGWITIPVRGVLALLDAQKAR